MKPLSPLPLGKKERFQVALVLVGLAGMWALALYAYASFPRQVPVHFNFSGRPDRFGSRNEILILPLAFSLAPIILLLAVRFRFILVNRFPFLINLPAFYIRLHRLSPEEQSVWLNRYFELLLTLNVTLTGYLLILEWGILWGTARGGLPWWFLTFTIGGAVLLIVLFLFRLAALDREMSRAVDNR